MNEKIGYSIASLALASAAFIGVIVISKNVLEPALVDFVMPCVLSVLLVAMAILANANRQLK